MRDKLIELIASKVCDTYSEACEEWLPHDCGKCYANNCHIAEIADHLIAHGVTFAADNNVAYKLKATEPLTNCQQWIPVKERLPEPFEPVYVYDSTKKRVTDAYLTRHMEWVGVQMNHEVTHWMRWPTPPEGVE